MASEKPTIVLIHGGWHVPETYSKLTEALRSEGYDVHIPRLPSVSNPTDASLASDTVLVRSYVEGLVNLGRYVVAIMYSYGGQVGTNALHGLSVASRAKSGAGGGGVSHLIYMCAFALPDGGSMVGKVKEFGHEDLLPLAFDFADDGTVLCREPRALIGDAPGVDEAEIEVYLESLVRWNGSAMYREIEHCAWRETEVTYIYTTQDMITPLDYQKSMVEEMERQGKKVHTVQLETGHCANLTATVSVVNTVKTVVEGRFHL
jgi:pimeloyl-ACP methyl ester carboxylesterase